jgi:hypothetical protein
MKITEQTTLAELQAYLKTLDEPELAVTRKRQSCMGHGKPCAHAYCVSACPTSMPLWSSPRSPRSGSCLSDLAQA